MITATVLGPVWATKRLEGFPSGALLEVQRDETVERFVALDSLGSGPGDRVLIALGSSVSDHLPGSTPVDALVIGVLDEPRTSDNAPSQKEGTSHE